MGVINFIFSEKNSVRTLVDENENKSEIVHSIHESKCLTVVIMSPSISLPYQIHVASVQIWFEAV